MIAKPVTITYNVDEQTNVGILDGKYVKFIDEVPQAILPADVMNEYVAAQIRIPDEFAEAREAVQTKINALQAVL